ncbi:MAG: glycerate kinase [Deltaproteobacteria bacterium]|nr:glycerate kinase [Deltaproteobacteria bacterium]
MNRAQLLKEIFYAGIRAASSRSAVRGAVKAGKDRLIIRGTAYRPGRVIVIGAGKASVDMALALEDLLGRRIDAGVVVTKYGHARGKSLKRITVMEAGHPLPDENSVRAAKAILGLGRHVDRDTLVINLLSGGASSLLALPDGISLRDKVRTSALLLGSGADIREVNTVRAQLSLIKGGRLGRALYPARVVSLIVSDVIGNDIDTIGSGPTAGHGPSAMDAVMVIERYGLSGRVPASVMERLRDRARHPDRPGHGARIRNIVLSDNMTALRACVLKARQYGLRPVLLTHCLHGEAREAAMVLASIATYVRMHAKRDVCLMSGGETTVTVRGRGKGGRSQEFALSFAMEIADSGGISLLSAGTDGTDGPTDAAGAVVDTRSAARMEALGMPPRRYLDNNDAYTALGRAGCLFKTGPTGTNVMDIQLIYVQGRTCRGGAFEDGGKAG